MRYATLALTALMIGSSVAPAMAQMRPPTPLTAAQFAGARPGQSVQLVVRVDNIKGTNVRATLLEQIGDEKYKATKQHIQLYFPEQTPVVMGTSRDVASNAILSIAAVATKVNQADIKQVTVITNYVKVQ